MCELVVLIVSYISVFYFMFICLSFFFFFKQKTAYEMRISDWSSDVCSSDLYSATRREAGRAPCRDIRNSLAVSAGNLMQRGQNGRGAPPQTRAVPVGDIGLLTMNGVGHFKSSTAPIEEACLPIRFRDCRTFSSAMSASRVSQDRKSTRLNSSH